MNKIREPIVEGLFYPESPAILNNELNNLLDSASPTNTNAIGIIVPHAALKYSGLIAATGYKAVLPRIPEIIVILGPIHNSTEDAIIFPESNLFRISDKFLTVDTIKLKQLSNFGSNIIYNDIPHLEEHTIEVQLIFIQNLFPKALILPILLAQPRLKTLKNLANLFQQVLKQNFYKTLFVASANLTSFLQKTEAEKQAKFILEAIQKKDPEYLLFNYEEGNISSCGIPAIVLLMYLLKDKADLQILALGNSADANEEQTACIQYAAIGFFNKEEKNGGF